MPDTQEYFLVPRDRQLGIACKLMEATTITIGRGKVCDIILGDPEVSRSHARLEIGSNGVEVQDIGSTNGTFIEEMRISSADWPPGKVLRIGSTELVLATGAYREPFHPDRKPAKQIFILEWTRRGDDPSRPCTKAVNTGGGLVAGRHASCDIILDDSSVSESHARLDVLASGILVRNLSQTASTYIGDRAVAEGEWLLGQTLTIGAYDFKIHVRDSRFAEEPAELRIAWRHREAGQQEEPKWVKLQEGKAVLIGREPGCDVVLEDFLVSRKHAKIELNAQGVQVEDLDSTNGTKLGGRPIRLELWSGDELLEIGNYTLSIGALPVCNSHEGGSEIRFVPQPVAAPKAPSKSGRLRVFISYSRKDLVIADKLTTALEGNGFEVMIDRRDLPYGEKWQHELANFIRNADTVLFLVSPGSVHSQWCSWELKQVVECRKRLFPLVIGTVPLAELPAEVQQVHLLPRSGEFDFAKDFSTLINALNRNQAWIMEHTRLYNWAQHWIARKQPGGMLLRGAALKYAKAWMKSKPSTETIASEVLELISRSQRKQLSVAGQWLIGFSLAVFIIYLIPPAIEHVNEWMHENQTVPTVQTVQEIDEFRSEFFSRLGKLLKGRNGIRIEGDRFIFESEVLFDSGQAQIRAEGRTFIDQLAEVIKDLDQEIARKAPGISNWVVQVDGHTDKRPISNSTFPSNLELSLGRATSVVRYLISKGVPAKRLVPAGRGETQPLDTGDSEEALQRNRRIELRLTNG